MSIGNQTLNQAINKVASLPDIRTIIDIGAADGSGSITAIADGLKDRAAIVHGLEITTEGLQSLNLRFGNDGRFSFLQCSSVDHSRFPDWERVEYFHREAPPTFRRFPLAQLWAWRERDLEWARNAPNQAGIRHIKGKLGVEVFDLAIIDGSEFSGAADLEDIYGSKYIILDDTECFKNFANARQLFHDERYQVSAYWPLSNNGVAVFQRKG